MRPISMIATSIFALAVASPLAAFAQDAAAQQRMLDSQRNLQQFEQNQRIEQVQRNLENLDTRVRTDQNLRDSNVQRGLVPPPSYDPLVGPATPATPADIRAAEVRREAAISASEARLKALADQQLR